MEGIPAAGVLEAYADSAWFCGHTGEAIRIYTCLLQTPKRASDLIHLKLGFLHLSNRHNDKAREHFTSQIQIFGDVDPNTFVKLDALKSSDLSLRWESYRSSKVLRTAALHCCYEGIEETYPASRDIDKFIDESAHTARSALDSLTDGSVKLAMASYYRNFGLIDRADGYLRKCHDFLSNRVGYWIEAGEILIESKSYRAALNKFEQGLALTSNGSLDCYHCMLGRGIAEFCRGNYKTADELVLPMLVDLHSALVNATKIDDFDHIFRLYQRGTSVYTGICLLRNDLKTSNDTLANFLKTSEAIGTHCVPPIYYKRLSNGNRIGKCYKVSIKTLREAVRHINEIESRYGPDPYLYFHRSNLLKALGDWYGCLRDLSLVSCLNPSFLKLYLDSNCLNDRFNNACMAWIPIYFVEALYDSLQIETHVIPTPMLEQIDEMVAHEDHGADSKPESDMNAKKNIPIFSERAIWCYFDRRIGHNRDDTYAAMFQSDINRRIAASKHTIVSDISEVMAFREGVMLENTKYFETEEDKVQDSRLNKVFPEHPIAYLLCGIVKLEQLNANIARKYFTKALSLFSSQSTALSEFYWNEVLILRAKAYILIWRSVASQVLEDVKASLNDIRLAGTALNVNYLGNQKLLIFIVRSVKKLLSEQVRLACNNLAKCQQHIESLQRGSSTRKTIAVHQEVIKDMFANVGLRSFHLFPKDYKSELYKHILQHDRFLSNLSLLTEEQYEYELDYGVHTPQFLSKDSQPNVDNNGHSLVSALPPPLTEQSMEGIFAAGIHKLSKTGSITSGMLFFQSIISTDKAFCPSGNTVRINLRKGNDMEPNSPLKLPSNLQLLYNRADWLDGKVQWKFAALEDLNVLHDQSAHDVACLKRRGLLYKKHKNYTAALADITECLQLIANQVGWKLNKKSEHISANILDGIQRPLWFQLLLLSGEVKLRLGTFKLAAEDFSLIIEQAGSSERSLLPESLNQRIECYICTNQYHLAILDIDQLVTKPMHQFKLHDKDYIEVFVRGKFLNLLLAGNLYCQQALEQLTLVSLKKFNSVGFKPWSIHYMQHLKCDENIINQARLRFLKCLEILPMSLLIHFFIGRMCFIAGETKNCIIHLTQCLKINPLFLPALFLRGCIYLNKNLISLAMFDFMKVHKRNAGYPNLRLSIGYCNYVQGNISAVVETATEAIMMGCDDVDVFYLRGCALRRVLAVKNASHDFQEILIKCPDHHDARLQLSICYILLHKYAEASDLLRQAVLAKPDRRLCWELLAYASACEKNYDEAVLSYTRSIDLAIRDNYISSHHYLQRAHVRLLSANYEGALIDINLALRLVTDSPQILATKAFALCKLKRENESMKAIEDFVRNYDDGAKFSSDLAKNDKLGQAQAQLKILKDPNNLIRVVTSNSVSNIHRVSNDTDSCCTQEKYMNDNDMKRNISELGTGRLAMNDNDSVETSIDSARRAVYTRYQRIFHVIAARHRISKLIVKMKEDKAKRNNRIIQIASSLMQKHPQAFSLQQSSGENLMIWVYNTLGLDLIKSKQYDSASLALNMAIKLYSNSFVPRFNLACAYMRQRKTVDSISEFEKVLHSKEDCFEAYNNIGVSHFRIKNFNDAQAAFLKGLAIAKNKCSRANLLYNLGTVSHALGRYEEAMYYYNQAIELNAGRYEYFLNRGFVLHFQENSAQALEDYDRAIQLLQQDKGHEQYHMFLAYLNRCQVHLSLGHCTKGMLDIEFARKLRQQDEKDDNFLHCHEFLKSDIASTCALEPNASLGTRRNEGILIKELDKFTKSWKKALQIASVDFLFALQSIPCFAYLEAYTNLDERINQSCKGGDFDIKEDTFVCLPIWDSSFFDFERDLLKAVDPESQLRSFVESDHDLLMRVLISCQAGRFLDAMQIILKAHYSCTIDSHQEYLLAVWRLQIMLKLDMQLHEAIEFLKVFLSERKFPDRPIVDRIKYERSRVPVDYGTWEHQRSIIWSDLYHLLGSLYQLNGQYDLAEGSFLTCLRLRPDHFIAQFNFLQLCFQTEKYEDILDIILRVLELCISIHKDPSAIQTSGNAGLFNQDRSLCAISPKIIEFLSNSNIAIFTADISMILEEYRKHMTARVFSNSGQIFHIQGLLAIAVDKIKAAVEIQQFTADLGIHDRQGTTLNSRLELLNQKAKLTSSYRHHDAAKTSTSASSISTFRMEFEEELRNVCQEIESSTTLDLDL